MTEFIAIDSPGFSLEFGEPGHPLVIVIHDWFGRLRWLHDFGQALAERGFRVIIPDLFNGVGTTDSSTASQLRDQVDVGLSLEMVDDVIDTARNEGSQRIGVIGFSMGGWLALLHAQGGGADAVVAYYASLDEAEHGVTPCPVLLQLAEVDDWPKGGEPENFVAHLKEDGTPVTEFTYAGTEHSFANESIPGNWDPTASALSFERTMAFLEEHLRD